MYNSTTLTMGNIVGHIIELILTLKNIEDNIIDAH